MSIRDIAAVAREHYRLRRLARWSHAPGQDQIFPEGKRVGFLAGYGNTSYGDCFIGLGLAKAAESVGFAPVILARDSEIRVFENAGIEVHVLPDRDHGLDEFVEVVRSLDALVLGGGGLFEDRVDATPSQLLAAGYAARALYASNFGIPMAVHGVGVETDRYAMRGTEKLLRRVMRSARVIGVRDAESVQACARFGVEARLVVDPAVIYLDGIRRSVGPEEGTAGFIPFARRAWPNMSEPSAEDHERQQIDWERAANELSNFQRVVIVPFHRTDLNFCSRINDAIATRNPDTKVEIAEFAPEAPGQVLDTLSRCEHVLTMRYHGFMASHFAGVPSIAVLGKSQKLRTTDRLNKSGRLPDVWDARVAGDQLRATLDEVDKVHQPAS